MPVDLPSSALAPPWTGLTVAERATHLIGHHRLALAVLWPALLRRIWLQRKGLIGEVPLPQGHGMLPCTWYRVVREGGWSGRR